MRKAALFGLFVLLAGLAAGWAQNLETNTAPKYLWIGTDSMKPDVNHQAYAKFSKQFKEAMATTDFRWLAEYPIAGNANQISYVTFLDSTDALEKLLAAGNEATSKLIKQDEALWNQANSAIAGTQLTLAKFRPDLSSNVDKVDFSKATRYHIVTFQLLPGAAPQSEALIKEWNGLGAKAGSTTPSILYSILAGKGYPGFILITPLESLAGFDLPDSPELNAVFTPIVRQHLMDEVRKTTEKVTSEIYFVHPGFSRPPQSYIAANPGFWQVKEEPVVATTPQKKIKKEKPAALKEKQ